MQQLPSGQRSRRRDLLGLAAFLALCLGVSALGGAFTASSVSTWYQDLAKPWYTPPDWLFAPVWTLLYLAMAVAAWRVWRSAAAGGAWPALGVFGLQLALNLGWSAIFFGLRAPGPALLELLFLLGAILATILRFRRHDRLAALLLWPYLLWAGYAGLLNAGVWWLNR